MAISPSARLGITRWSAGGDTFTRLQLDGDHSTLDSKTAIYLQSTAGTRPAAGIEGRYHFATDTKVVTYDDGVSWRTVTGGASNDGTKLLSLGGNLTVSGAYATTLTVSNTTNVTLPTSGTLVNDAVTALNNLVSVDTTSTTSHTFALGTGATASGQTKTVNLGGGGLTGSTTAITLGPTAGTVTITLNGLVSLGAGGPTITSGSGAPSHSAPNGSSYHRTDGTIMSTLYVRAEGAWTALSGSPS